VDIALQASAPGAVADLAQRGLGVAILSESMVTGHSDRLQALVIDDVERLAVLALIWTSAQSPALGGLLAHCRRTFAGSVDPASRHVSAISSNRDTATTPQ
jgi:DNA-binding transcriptional LysR family regulator